jgi:hypothetical protein
MDVEYRDIPGHPGYRVGNDGSVWTCISTRRRPIPWKIKKPAVNEKGYLSVNLSTEPCKYKTFRVHRLVLTSFAGPCPEGMQCRHLNGKKTDCRLENLKWGTPAENYADNRRLGVMPRGESHPTAKLTDAQVDEVRAALAAGELRKDLAEKYGVAKTTIWRIANRKRRFAA